MHLTTVQRSAVRAIHDGDTASVDIRTLTLLVGRGYVTDSRRPKLTPKGYRTYDRIMASGDGPEDLKARFRL